MTRRHFPGLFPRRWRHNPSDEVLLDTFYVCPFTFHSERLAATSGVTAWPPLSFEKRTEQEGQ
ncbi:MAG: hypothetical protein IT387_01065 [Nitrospira sp.]|nr:hypothetical protein [Nitrospira sp.]HPW15958.1 hypothetical protein [Nitrospira sp.]